MSKKSKPRKPRSDEELGDFSGHLLYEVQMLCSLCERMSMLALGATVPWEVENAMLESWAVHARGLVEFFDREPDDPRAWATDALATHYFDSPGGWACVRPPLAESLEPIRERTGAEIAHMTYKRAGLAAEARTWSYGTMTADSARVIATFVMRCPSRMLQPGFRQAAWKALPGFVTVELAGRGHAYKPPPAWPPGASEPEPLDPDPEREVRVAEMLARLERYGFGNADATAARPGATAPHLPLGTSFAQGLSSGAAATAAHPSAAATAEVATADAGNPGDRGDGAERVPSIAPDVPLTP